MFIILIFKLRDSRRIPIFQVELLVEILFSRREKEKKKRCRESVPDKETRTQKVETRGHIAFLDGSRVKIRDFHGVALEGLTSQRVRFGLDKGTSPSLSLIENKVKKKAKSKNLHETTQQTQEADRRQDYGPILESLVVRQRRHPLLLSLS